MTAVTYRPIGLVRSPYPSPVRPELIRAVPATLILEERFIPAIAALQPGQNLIVVYHLDRIEAWQDQSMPELFTKRAPCRPNPIGVTLVQVLAVDGATITVLGLDAIDGTPLLDIKPYKPIYDTPPEPPQTQPLIVLTGGPGGGKSSFIEDLRNHPDWSNRFVCLPEAVQYARFTNLDPADRLFQRVVVNLQIGLEDGLRRACEAGDDRPVICHRGSLDPLAFWRLRGWPVDEFFEFTGLSIEQHYRRYTAVLHLVTAADGAGPQYARWPLAHRPEEAPIAVQLDGWLGEAWQDHPHYYRIDNLGRDWPAKSREALRILEEVLEARS